MRRNFSTEGAVATQEEPQEESLADINARIGVDSTFSKQKHAYVLTFPWNFDEIIEEFSARHRPMADNSFWSKFVVNSRAIDEFNILFRKFH